jgi:hypothetical protein
MSKLQTLDGIQSGTGAFENFGVLDVATRFLATLAILVSVSLVWMVRPEPQAIRAIGIAARSSHATRVAGPGVESEWRPQRPNEGLDAMYRSQP